MGLFDRFFKGRQAGQQMKSFETFTAYSPRFQSWNGQIYESELVRAAVDAKARHISKLAFSMQGSSHRKLWTRTRSAPNPWMTWSAFLERSSNIYEIQNNLFIIPMLDAVGDVEGFFPVVPSMCEVVESNGEAFLRFTFSNGKKGSIQLRRVGVVAKHQLGNDFFGEPNRALNATMELVNMVNQGIMEGVKNSASYRFMAQVNNHMFDEDVKRERERFDKNNFQTAGGGLLLFDGKFTNIKELSNKQYTVDPEQMKLIRENVCNYFGVNEEVIQNRANGVQLDAFFNGAVEPFAIKLSDAMSGMVYTERERNNGDCIMFTANRLQYMDIASKVSMVKELSDRGLLMVDEGREIFNLPPLPDGAGQRVPVRGEYYDAIRGKEDEPSIEPVKDDSENE